MVLGMKWIRNENNKAELDSRRKKLLESVSLTLMKILVFPSPVTLRKDKIQTEFISL